MREFADRENRTFTREYMEMRCKENDPKDLSEYYRGLNEFIQKHRSTENKSNCDDYNRRRMRTFQIMANAGKYLY